MTRFKKNTLIFFLLGFFCVGEFAVGQTLMQSSTNPVFGNPQHLKPVTGSWNPWRIKEGYALGVMSNLQSRPAISLLYHTLNAFYTLEGDLKLGQFSTAGGILHHPCFENEMRKAPWKGDTKSYQKFEQQAEAACTQPVNPWHFSNMDEDLLNPISTMSTRYVLVYFNSYVWIPFVESDNIMAKIFPTDSRALKQGDIYEIHINPNEIYRKGDLEGRFVLASLDGVIRKAYEVVVQQSNSGNHFEALSVNDKGMFNFILKAMLSGQFLRISYARLKTPSAWIKGLIFGYNTPFRVYKVEVLPETQEEKPPKP